MLLFRPGFDRVAPPGYYGGAGFADDFAAMIAGVYAGHFPFDVLINGYSGYYYPQFGSASTFNLRVGGIDVPDSSLILGTSAGSGGLVRLANPAPLPGVTPANVDGASLIAIVTTDPGSGICNAVLDYTAASAADLGKQVMGIGHKILADTGSVGAFSGFFSAISNSQLVSSIVQGTTGSPINTRSIYFGLSYEDVFGDRSPGTLEDVRVLAAQYWPLAGTFSDFLLVIHSVGGADGHYRFGFRKNGVTVLTLECTANGDRVISPVGATTVDVNEGDRVCWLCEAVDGGAVQLDAELIWAFRAGEQSVGPAFGDAGVGGGGL